MIEWISVHDMLPGRSCNCIATDGETVAELRFENRNRFGLWLEPSSIPNEPIDDITHWMPLPEPPKE